MDDYMTYIKPQESSNKSEVRWMISGDGQMGLLIAGQEPLNMSVWPYTLENIDEAGHTTDLVKSDYLTVNIDKLQMGLGGDDSWSMNAKPHEAFRIYPQVYRYQFRIRAIGMNDSKQAELIYYWLPEY